MGKRVWYNIYGWGVIDRHFILLAKVRSEGLANLTAEFYRQHYTDVRIE